MIQSFLLCIKSDPVIVFYMQNFSLCVSSSDMRFIYECFTFLVIFVVTSRLKQDRGTLSVSVSSVHCNKQLYERVWKAHSLMNTERKAVID